MKYAFVTLATGDRYLESAKMLSVSLNDKSNSHVMVIATNLEVAEQKNTIFHKIPDGTKLTTGKAYNYNLKYYPIKCAVDYDVVIYVDADWRLHENFSEAKVLNFLDNFLKSDMDFLFERPHKIGPSKKSDSCFWRNKIAPYNLLETSEYDDCDVCNEQFLVFRGGEKLKLFCDFWEKRCRYLESIDGWAFAEGVEIGMSAKDANFKSTHSFFPELVECFKFNSVSGQLYERF